MIGRTRGVVTLLFLGAAALIGGNPAAVAADNYYDLSPRKIAANTYVIYGVLENFNLKNHGAISNTAFIVTDDGVVVIDTGPSKLYGQALRAAIGKVTSKPVAHVYITHAHPDHFLGNNAFEDVPISALPGTINAIRSVGEDLADNLYNLVGPAMRGTTAFVPTQTVNDGDTVRFGQHELQMIAVAGHTAADLMLLDKTTGVLFAGDIAFYKRAATTPNADLAAWQQSLAATEKRDFKIIVPGHGPISHDAEPLRETSAYLHWLRARFVAAAKRGDSEAEVLFEALPPRWAALAVEPGEYHRSVSHLYPSIEEAMLPEVSRPAAH